MTHLSAVLLAVVAASCRATTEGVAQGPVLPPGVVTFEGNERVSTRSLKKAIVDDVADWNRLGHPKASIDDAAFHLERHLRERGHPFAEVDYETGRLADGSAHARFLVREGPRTVVERIVVEGNEALDDDDLAAFLGGPRTGWFGLGRLLLVEARVRDAAEAMRSAYQAIGHLDVEVDEPRIDVDATRTRATVTFVVREGIAYRLTSIEFAGDPRYPSEDLRRAVAHMIGRPYFSRVAWSIRSRLVEVYGNRGHPDAWIAFDESRDSETGDVGLVFTIHPGPIVRVGEIRVSGNVRTRESFVRARLHLESGEDWSLKRERKSFRDLYRSGLFRTVRLALDPDTTGTERALDVVVDEAPAIELFAEPGFGSYELFRLTGGFRHRNLFGTGRLLDTEGTVAVRAQKATAGVTEPWFLGTDVSANLSGFASRREEPSFTSQQFGGGLLFTKEWSSNFATSFDYTFRRSEIADVDFVDPAVLAALENVDISAVGFTPVYDSRDDLLVPRRGYVLKLRVEWADEALGSEIDFVRTTWSHAHFFGIRDGTVLGVTYRVGAIVPIDTTQVIPLQERFYNGGENTVRSFQEDELGPKDAFGNPIGGEAFLVVSTELRQRLFGNLDGAVFHDMGNLIPAYEDVLRLDDLRHGVGLGLRYRLPIGPIRLDAAVNPDPRSGEEDWAVHVSVGMAF